MQSPLFSILITSYNRPEYLGQCIGSVMSNTGVDFEIIISDDASPAVDKIDEVMRQYLGDSRVNFHRQKQNIGEPANRNFLVNQSQGQYTIILCDDDMLAPRALQGIRNQLTLHPDHDLYGLGYSVIDGGGDLCYSRVAPAGIEIDLEHPENVRRLFEAKSLPFLICHPSSFCCKQGVERRIPYRNDVCTADDLMFLLECINEGERFYIIPENLVYYRSFLSAEATQQINQSADTAKVLQSFARVYYALQQREDLNPLVSNLIRGRHYRARFLYSQILRRMYVDHENLATLDITGHHKEELLKYAAKPWTYLLLLRTYLSIAVELTQLFGVCGIIHFYKVVAAYCRYNVFAHRRWLSMPIALE